MSDSENIPSLLDGAYTPPELVDPDAIVCKMRICYDSGAFIEGWFKNFKVDVHRETQRVTAASWEPPELPVGAMHVYFEPTHIGVTNIETIWTMAQTTALNLYIESTPKFQ